MPSAAVRPTCKPFGASWPTADRSASLSLKQLKNCLAPRFKLQSAASCTPLPSFLSAGLSNAHLRGSKNAAVCGKTANGNSIPACSSSTWPSSYYCSKDREQILSDPRSEPDDPPVDTHIVEPFLNFLGSPSPATQTTTYHFVYGSSPTYAVDHAGNNLLSQSVLAPDTTLWY